MYVLQALFLFVGSLAGIMLAVLLAWQALLATLRLVLAMHTPTTVALLLGRLSDATRKREPWEPVLRGLRLELPWPWPWRLARAADRLAAGEDPAEVLGATRLLPATLRQQAAQALGQGPEAFAQWCVAITRSHPADPLPVRQGVFLLAELAVVVGLLHFLGAFIFPKFQWIFSDMGLPPSPLFAAMYWFMDWELPLFAGVVVLVSAGCMAMLAWRWRRRRRHAAARLLLVGSAARLPESALGAEPAFPALCAAAGWRAASPVELAWVLTREEQREARHAAWVPSVLAALAPMVAAIPIGLVVIGIMQMLVSIIYQLEAQT